MSDPLNSPNAVGGRVYLLCCEQTARGEIGESVISYDDTIGDFGDAFTADERFDLAIGLRVERFAHGGRISFRDMVRPARAIA